MEKGYINIDETEINNITTHLGKNQNHLNTLNQSTNGGFRNLKNSNLFGNGITRINKQIGTISDTVSMINNIVKTKTHEMFELDNRLSQEAEQIEVPTEFITNNSVRNHIFDGITLTKNDGKNINHDNSLKPDEINFDSSISKTAIDSIVNNNSDLSDIELRNYKTKNINISNINNNKSLNSSNVQYSEDGFVNANISNINKQNELLESKFEEQKIITNQETLKQINSNIEQNVVELNAESKIKYKELNEITKNNNLNSSNEIKELDFNIDLYN